MPRCGVYSRAAFINFAGRSTRLDHHEVLDLKLSIQLTNYSSLSAVKTVFPPTCNLFFFWPLSAISAIPLLASHLLRTFSLLPYYSLPRRMRHNIILITPLSRTPALFNFEYIRVREEPRPQSTNYCCGVYMRAAFIRLKDDIRAAFIRGRRLFEGGVYIRKYGTSSI